MRTKTKANTNGREANGRPPRDGLFRALAERPAIEVRAAADDGSDDGMPTLSGHFAVFNEWTEIDSLFEGHFLERIAPGAFKKTFSDQRDAMRVLFQHGMDFNIGDKPLGPIRDIREDETGAYYEVPMLDTSYNRDELLPGLEAGLYGASFRFRVMREEFEEEPDASDDNPKGLPERTIKEAQVLEFGPVTFPAYPSATAGVRSLTDEFFASRMAHDPETLRKLVSFADLKLPERSKNGSPAQRQDTEDLDTLGQMLSLANDYIDEQDEGDAGEQDCITQMQGVVSTLTDLVAYEATEEEPDEPEDDEMNSAEPEGTERSEEAEETTSQEAGAEPAEETEPEEGDAGGRSTSPPGREPLRPYRGKETTSWPRL